MLFHLLYQYFGWQYFGWQYFVWQYFGWQCDVVVFNYINHWPHFATLNFVAIFLDYATKGMLIYAILYLFLLIRKKYTAAIFIFVSMLITDGIVDLILKPLINRPRPFTEIAGTILIHPLPTSASFPSAQSAVAFAVAMACVLIFKNEKWLYLWIWALLIAVDRVYMGHHYPSDVIVGALIGIAVPYFLLAIARRWHKLERQRT